MTEELRTKLAGDLLRQTAWDDLKMHAYRGVVFVVRERSLIEAGVALAQDDSDTVGAWVEQGVLARPTPDELSRWGREKTRFASIVIQPFVLIQEEPDAPAAEGDASLDEAPN